MYAEVQNEPSKWPCYPSS